MGGNSVGASAGATPGRFFIGGNGIPHGLSVSDLFLSALEEAHLERALAISRTEYEREPQGPPPTKTEILNSLEEVCLDLVDLKDGNEHCVICMEEQHCGDLALKLPCGHAFHKTCVVPWLKKHCTCPVCRLELNSIEKEKLDREREKHQKLRAQRRKEHEDRLEQQRMRMQAMNNEENKNVTSNVAENEIKNVNSGTEDQKTGEETEMCELIGENGYGYPPEKKHCARNSASSSSMGTNINSIATTGSSVKENDDKSTWTVRDLRNLLGKLGLQSLAANALEKSELIKYVELASCYDSLKELPVSELKRRIRYIQVRGSSNIPANVVEKSELVNCLIENVNRVIANY
mmetsp:Transcript_11217/g.14019  ORF Transcript_11217/g.14019 Transcript_11217/m.14019 type:complete len:348 (+) Transcript_11217:213-1256(+)